MGAFAVVAVPLVALSLQQAQLRYETTSDGKALGER
jgi:hypothetical protein